MQAERHQRAVEPAARPEIGQQPFSDQHGAERDRQHQDGGQQALAAHQAHPERDRDRDDEVEDRHRHGEPERARRACRRGTARRRSAA